MKKLIYAFFIFSLFFSTSAYAHVVNEKTIYDDIEFSKATEQIVYLRALNVIPYVAGANLFKPQEKLSKSDLDLWSSTYKKGKHKETLQGNATYADVNKAYFDGKATVDNPSNEITHEEFALFVGKYITEKINGKSLLESNGFESGPTGTIEGIKSTTAGEGEKAYKVFQIIIDKKAYQVSEHPKILYGLVDLNAWVGKKIKQTWVTGDKKELTIIVLEKDQFNGKGPAKAVDPTRIEIIHAKTTPPIAPIVISVVLIVLLTWIFIKKKKKDA
jgi:hypothetical protein